MQRLDVVCLALVTDTEVGGVLVVSRDLSQAAERTPGDLDGLAPLASWLRTSIEAQLITGPTMSSDEMGRLAALRRALSVPESTTSEVGLLRIFGQALAIWDDIEVHGYLENRHGEFVKQVAPAGQSRTIIPDDLPVALMPRTRELTRLSGQTRQQLGIASNEDVFTALLGSPENGLSWLLVLSGSVHEAAQSRLALYVEFLQQCLETVTASATLRLQHALWRRLLSFDAQVEQAANAALEEVRAAVGADVAAVVLTLPRGTPALTAGDTSALADLHGSPAGNCLMLTRPLPGHGTLVLAAGRTGGLAFTLRDERVLESAVDTLIPWAAGVLRRPEYNTERRAARRSFAETLDRVAAHASESGSSASVLVIRLMDPVLPPGLTHSLAARVKSYLRAPEPAGALADGEVAALLYDTTPAQAGAVVARLRQLIETGAEGEALRSASIEIAHCPAGTTYEPSLLTATRDRAAGRPAIRAAIQ